MSKTVFQFLLYLLLGTVSISVFVACDQSEVKTPARSLNKPTTKSTTLTCVPLGLDEITKGFGLSDDIVKIDASKLKLEDPEVTLLNYTSDSRSFALRIRPIPDSKDPNFVPDYASYSVVNADKVVCSQGKTSNWLEEIPIPPHCEGVLKVIVQACASEIRLLDPEKKCGEQAQTTLKHTANAHTPLNETIEKIKTNEIARTKIAHTLSLKSTEFLKKVLLQTQSAKKRSSQEEMLVTIAKIMARDEEQLGAIFASKSLYSEFLETAQASSAQTNLRSDVSTELKLSDATSSLPYCGSIQDQVKFTPTDPKLEFKANKQGTGTTSSIITDVAAPTGDNGLSQQVDAIFANANQVEPGGDSKLNRQIIGGGLLVIAGAFALSFADDLRTAFKERNELFLENAKAKFGLPPELELKEKTDFVLTPVKNESAIKGLGEKLIGIGEYRIKIADPEAFFNKILANPESRKIMEVALKKEYVQEQMKSDEYIKSPTKSELVKKYENDFTPKIFDESFALKKTQTIDAQTKPLDGKSPEGKLISQTSPLSKLGILAGAKAVLFGVLLGVGSSVLAGNYGLVEDISPYAKFIQDLKDAETKLNTLFDIEAGLIIERNVLLDSETTLP